MKHKGKLRVWLLGITGSIYRWPLTAICLLAATVLISITIQDTHKDYSKIILSLVVGSFLGIVSQAVYERFFVKALLRNLLMGAAILLTVVQYLVGFLVPDSEYPVKTAVFIFALLTAWLWIPSIKSRVSFNESFTAAFKAFFLSLFFSGVLFLGILLILTAIDKLIIPVDEKINLHAANIIFVLFAPLYFLSLIPDNSRRVRNDNREDVEKPILIAEPAKDNERRQDAASSQGNETSQPAGTGRFLEILISYIIIPLAAVFTIILLLYIILNITGSFWTDNLLEPMLITYTIVVILLYLLASGLENLSARIFRRVFPKVLVPIVLFQTVSSCLRIREAGITCGRYYVILFGIFAAAAGLFFCFLPVRKNGIIAPVLLVLSLISILPPADAFTVSRFSQTKRLESLLERNNMLKAGTLVPGEPASQEDKQSIYDAYSYLNRMGYTGRIKWLPADTADFTEVFGFSPYEDKLEDLKSYNFTRESTPLNISGYDLMIPYDLYLTETGSGSAITSFEKNGSEYKLQYKRAQDYKYYFILSDDKGNELFKYPIQQELDSRFLNRVPENGEITSGEAEFTAENDRISFRLEVENISYNKWKGGENYSAKVYILLELR